MAANPLLSLDLGSTIGVGYLGTIISAALYGVTCVQSFYYYRSCAKDGWILRNLVTALLILDTLHQAFITHIIYYYAVTNYANPASLLVSVWSIPSEILVNASITFLVQCAWIVRLWTLSKSYILTGISIILTLTHFGLNLAYPIKGFLIPSLQEAAVNLKVLGATVSFVDVVTIAFISGSLCYFLYKNRTGFRRSDDLITKLIALIVASGVLPALFEIACAISYLAAPGKLYMLFFNVMIAKLYINAFLSSLNARPAGRVNAVNEQDSHGRYNTYPLPTVSAPSQVSSSKPITVVVEEEMDYKRTSL